MYSRAHLLIELEQRALQKDPPWGVEAEPLYDDTIFEWMAKIKGLKDTLWEGGVFKIYIKFDEHFNVRPPQVFFQTVPFHPNIEVTTGKPCVDFLDDKMQWKETYSLSMILVSLQTLLSTPVVKNAVNSEAASMLLNSPVSYAKLVKECVLASQKVEAGETTDETETETVIKLDASKQIHSRLTKTTHNQRPIRLSFEDYHSTWRTIATSNTNPDSIKAMKKLDGNNFGSEQFQRQLEEHNNLVYGIFKTNVSLEETKEAKLAQLNKMKEIYLSRKPAQVTHQADEHINKTSEVDDILEKEVDDLVNWTSNLNSNGIDATDAT